MKILFMSEEHSVKRKLAAQIAKHFAQDKYDVYQMKTAFDPTDHMLQSILGEVEIGFSEDHVIHSENLTRDRFDVIIMLCKSYRRKLMTFPGFPSILYWPIENPVKKGYAPHQIQQALRSMRDDLLMRIRHLFEDGYLDSFNRTSNQLYDMFDDKSQGILKFNREEIITGMNAEALELTGFTEDQIYGKPLHFLIPDDTVSRHALSVTDEGVGFRHTELKMKRVDREIIKIKATFKAFGRDRGLGGFISFEESSEEEVIQPMEGIRGLDRLSWDRVEAALKQTGGNRTKAARALGVGRATFYRFLDREKMKGRKPKTELV